MVKEFENGRLEFADRLRRLRERSGLTGVELATAVGWQQSKVSKIERGRQMPTDSDVVAWLQATGSASSATERMRRELRELRVEQIVWRQQLRDGHRARQERGIRDARSITRWRGVAVTTMPGLLQTPDYARAVFRTQCALLEVPDDVEASVAARIERQQVLYDRTKQIEVLLAEAALQYSVCEKDVLAGQLDRLISFIGLSTVRLGFLPCGQVLPHLIPHGFWILDDIVVVETVSQELRIADPAQVAVYERLVDQLWQVAVEGRKARALLAGTLEKLGCAAD